MKRQLKPILLLIWYQNVGEDYVEAAFQWAREADPDAKLFYNDYGIAGLGPKSDAVYNMVKDFKQRGIPIDGVGFQTHFWTGGYPSKAEIAENMARIEALGSL